jgi:hypothetical protein
MARYSAAICMRSHYADRMLGARGRPPPPGFCKDCGAPVITECPKCTSRLLRGYEGVMSVGLEPDMFCTDCGNPFPWADRQSIVTHLENLLQFSDDLDNADQLVLIEQIAVLTGPDEPEKRQVAAGERIKDLAPKAWAIAMPVLQAVLTAEIRAKLGIPNG